MFCLCGPGGVCVPGVAEGVHTHQHRDQGPRPEAGGVLRAAGEGMTARGTQTGALGLLEPSGPQTGALGLVEPRLGLWV